MSIQSLISVASEHSVLRVRDVYALEIAVFCIAVYGPYKPIISRTRQHGIFKRNCSYMALRESRILVCNREIS